VALEGAEEAFALIDAVELCMDVPSREMLGDPRSR
jgi:hypothetical protein